jgi:SET domain-containing protein
MLRDNASRLFTHMQQAFNENCFIIIHTAELTTNQSSASGFSSLQSRFNHSCTPNSKVEKSETKIERFAIKDIVAGEKIEFYCNDDFAFLSKHERLQHLIFACSCKTCLNESP